MTRTELMRRRSRVRTRIVKPGCPDGTNISPTLARRESISSGKSNTSPIGGRHPGRHCVVACTSACEASRAESASIARRMLRMSARTPAGLRRRKKLSSLPWRALTSNVLARGERCLVPNSVSTSSTRTSMHPQPRSLTHVRTAARIGFQSYRPAKPRLYMPCWSNFETPHTLGDIATLRSISDERAPASSVPCDPSKCSMRCLVREILVATNSQIVYTTIARERALRFQGMQQSDARTEVRQGAAEVVQRTVTLYFPASTDASIAAPEHVICIDVMKMEPQMEAVVFERPGAPEEVLSWREIPSPAPGPAELLIEVRARSIQPADLLFIAGHYRVQPRFPQIAGFDGTGTVVEIGADVLGFSVGQRVAFRCAGAWATLVAVPAERAYHVPPDLDAKLPDEVACQFALNPLTAWGLLDA